jgi:hypothetical protein
LNPVKYKTFQYYQVQELVYFPAKVPVNFSIIFLALEIEASVIDKVTSAPATSIA